MATETQYKFFRELYDEENQRYSLLEGRAKVFISILTLYIGALAFKSEEALKFLSDHKIPTVVGLGSGVVFVAALASCVFALRIKAYEGLADPESVIAKLPRGGLDDAVFLDDRIADLAVATSRNGKQNDESARALAVCAWLLFGGVLLQVSTFALAIWR